METKKNNSESKKIWTYAVILFTGAFAVLLVTAFSQIKLNKNITDYKNQLSSVEKKKVNFQTNLNTALEENKALLKKIEQMKKDAAKKEKEFNAYKGNVSKDQSSLKNSMKAYELLLEAENLYKNNDVVGSAELLQKKCDSKLLDKNGLARYNSLVEKTYYNAALKLYYDGYKYYKKQEYDAAISNLQAAVNLQPNEYFSDDCYYFIAYSQYKKGNKDGFKQAADALLLGYPDSSYIDEINYLLSK